MWSVVQTDSDHGKLGVIPHFGVHALNVGRHDVAVAADFARPWDADETVHLLDGFYNELG